MTKEATALRLDAALLAAMRRVRAQEGIPITTQIEFAVRAWLDAKGALPPPKRHTKEKKR